MKKIIPAILILLAPGCVAPAGLGGDNPAGSGGTGAAETGAGGVVIVFSNDTREQIEPCGCRINQWGGLARRGTLIERLGSPGVEVVPLDCGDIIMNGDGEGRFKFELIIDAMNEMGYRAATLGDREMNAGMEFIEKYMERAAFPIVSANIIDDDGGLILPASTALEVPGGRIIVTGVTESGPRDGLSVIDPLEAAGALAARTDEDDYLVVLAHTSVATASRIARIEGVDLVLGFGQYHTLYEPTAMGPARLGGVSGQAKTILTARILATDTGWIMEDYSIEPLSEDIPDDPDISALMAEYRRRVAEASPDPSAPPPYLEFHPPGSENIDFVGNTTCSICHREIGEAWSSTPHAEALSALASRDSVMIPDCLVCHSVGLTREGGYRPLRPVESRFGVGCEDCHGPGREHVRARSVGREDGDLLSAPPEALCRSCHTPEQDLDFDYERDSALVH